MRPPMKNEILPLCETDNRCKPIACCKACLTCMQANYFEAKAVLKSAFRDYIQALDFFKNGIDIFDAKKDIDLYEHEIKLYSDYAELLDCMDSFDIEVFNGK